MQTNLMKYSKTAKNFTFIKPVKITSLAESSKFMIFSDAEWFWMKTSDKF